MIEGKITQLSNYCITKSTKSIISQYQNHFSDSFHQCFIWRIEQITTKTSISNDLTSSSLFSFQANGEVRDKISHKLVKYVAKSSNDQIFLKVFDLVKLRMFNEAKAVFMKNFLHVFSLVKFFPKVPWPFNIRSFWVGPYGIDTFPDGLHDLKDSHRFLYNITEDDPAIITKIIVRHGNLIDSIQTYYKENINDENSRAGKKIGGTGGTGGNEYIISDLDNGSKYIVAINLKFSRKLLTVIKFTFNDGITYGLYSITDTLQIGPFGNNNEFRLSGINGGGGRIENEGVYVAHIAFQFQYVDSQ
ncbi:9197_t:CDS:2 [Funneliformis geosporum]|uniref:493_t:CDS:1 n=1 Tax=Funneliformis geosporum TaxID=1117311 RepID=A0A9W4T1Y7_9GLOM|nr:9197_t:CDS:2 [Funneliformis geosporum]CAI2187493.1 493_t:CDS:2 [Funneliformis geosporum]